jgi:hypothetical protein
MMIAAISAISFVLGATVAYVANGYPEYLAAIETVAGILLIGGLALLGYALESVLSHP